MALFPRPHDQLGSNGVSALSSAHVGNAFVDRVYTKLTPIYDCVFGAPLQPGRVAAVARM